MIVIKKKAGQGWSLGGGLRALREKWRALRGEYAIDIAIVFTWKVYLFFIILPIDNYIYYVLVLFLF